MSDAPTRALDEIRADWDRPGGKPVRHVPRLLAALERVLELAGEWDDFAASRGPATGPSAKLHLKHATALRAVIAAELLDDPPSTAPGGDGEREPSSAGVPSVEEARVQVAEPGQEKQR